MVSVVSISCPAENSSIRELFEFYVNLTFYQGRSSRELTEARGNAVHKS